MKYTKNITADNLIDAFVDGRFYIYIGDRSCSVYEACPEEGPAVRKRVANFTSESEARADMNTRMARFRQELKERFRICELSSASGPDSTAPPSESATPSSTRGRKKKLPSSSPASEPASTLAFTPPNSTDTGS